MTDTNRVTPFGTIEAVDQRGGFLGNRGCLHRPGGRVPVRPWATTRWITCALEFKGWRAPRWEPGRYTTLFFWDEAVALAAGHRPCALCRRPDFDRWCDAWESAFGDRPRVDVQDRRLHVERVDGRVQRRHRMPWARVPDGAFVVLDGGAAALVQGGELRPWSAAGYGRPAGVRPARGTATVLTPPTTAALLAAGYEPVVRLPG